MYTPMKWHLTFIFTFYDLTNTDDKDINLNNHRQQLHTPHLVAVSPMYTNWNTVQVNYTDTTQQMSPATNYSASWDNNETNQSRELKL